MSVRILCTVTVRRCKRRCKLWTKLKTARLVHRRRSGRMHFELWNSKRSLNEAPSSPSAADVRFLNSLSWMKVYEFKQTLPIYLISLAITILLAFFCWNFAKTIAGFLPIIWVKFYGLVYRSGSAAGDTSSSFGSFGFYCKFFRIFTFNF